MDAIVLDGEQRPTLAVTRSLGRKGIRVAVGAEKEPSLSSSSRFCSRSFVYPSPYEDPSGFMDAVMDFTARYRHSVLFPMTDVTLTEILMNRSMFPENIAIPFVDYGTYSQATDKNKLYMLARDLGVPVPVSFLSTDHPDHERLVETIRESGFPVVVKPSLSKIRTGKGWIDAQVQYARDERELREILSREMFHRYPFLIQKRIEGPGVGIFLLMDRGEVVGKFAHRRIREKPPSGGVSVLCESIEIPSQALQAAVKILAHLGWTGVAMVEFKIDRQDNVARLLEVNARFWGSLQLAISAGVDFPYLLYRMANGETIERVDGYTVGLKSRWELGDFDHLLIRLFKQSPRLNLQADHLSRTLLVKEFLLDFFRLGVKHEVMQMHDTKPFIHELKEYIRYFFR
jgi:predicted ATP-grasp superfamily ATP-dependent carboligase